MSLEKEVSDSAVYSGFLIQDLPIFYMNVLWLLREINL
jgi:hypothetical protein